MSDEGPAQVAEPQRNRTRLTEAERNAALDLIDELFGIDTIHDQDPLIDMPMIAQLAGVAPGTPGAWQQRTRQGAERVPFPEPDDRRYHDKPQWRAISTVIEGFLLPSNRWPRGSVARENTQVKAGDRMTFKELERKEPDLAKEIRALGAVDKRQRSLQGWRGWRTRAARGTKPGPQKAAA